MFEVCYQAAKEVEGIGDKPDIEITTEAVLIGHETKGQQHHRQNYKKPLSAP
jgi:hypothetical protein